MATADETAGGTQLNPALPQSLVGDLDVAIIEAINNAGEAVLNATKDKFVQEEVNRRVGLLSDGIATLRGLRSELRKIDRPDEVKLGRDRKPIGEPSYSKARLDQITQAEGKIKRLTDALNAAIKDKNFGQLDQTLKKVKSGKPMDDKDEEAETSGS